VHRPTGISGTPPVTQLFLLWIQKTYGPKKVLPRCLFPPVFNYNYDIEMNVEEGASIVTHG
jgi:hypothetical protein